jgi:hypothetical protein
MNVLITNIWLNGYGGTEVYVRDLAIALQQKGINTEVYSPEVGAFANEIMKAGIHVTDNMSRLKFRPDIIHAHHYIPAIEVLDHFGGVPAVYVLHGREEPKDKPPKHRRIMRYIASDHNTLDRLLLDEGIPAKHTDVLLNWVDISRFRLRENWRSKPVKALVFSNYASAANYLPVINSACEKMGIELDCVGLSNGNGLAKPELIIGDYDIVFAKAKAAMEAMATGASVIPCDYKGLGEMVTPGNYRHYREFNFGMRILNRPIQRTLIEEEIKKYDPVLAGQVAVLIRKEADMQLYIDKLLVHYQEAIANYRTGSRIYYFTRPGVVYTMLRRRISRVKRSVSSIAGLSKERSEQK